MAKHQLSPDEEFALLWERVGTLAFNQQKKVSEPLRVLHRLYHDPAFARHRPYLKLIRDWLVIPYSFWPRDFIGMARYLAEQLQAGHELSPRFILLMRFLRDFPPELAQTLVAANEHDVQAGKYDSWVRSNDRYEAHQKKVLNDPRLREEWAFIKSQFDVDQYRNPAGIIRRYVFSERNFKNRDWYFKFDDEEAAFYETFTAFCQRWDLWGVEREEFLLLKLTVNVLPVGLSIVIPTYMSLDAWRDIRWNKVGQLLRSLGATQMNARRIAAMEDRENEALRIHSANEEAITSGLAGQDRMDHIIKTAGLHPDTDSRVIRRRLAQAGKILKERRNDEFDHPSFHTPYSSEKFTENRNTHPAKTSTLACIKGAITNLSPEEKEDLIEWLNQ